MPRKSKRNVGYWFRKRRGWYTTEGRDSKPLTNEAGQHLKDPKTDKAELAKSLGRYLAAKEALAKNGLDKDATPLVTVCNLYLDSIKTAKTYDQRGRFLFDLTTGFASRFWPGSKTYKGKLPQAKDRLHDGYGDTLVKELIKGDVQRWLDKHPGWSDGGGQRGAVQALKRALNWAVEMGYIKTNPIKGFKVARGRARVTYFTPEQEAALLKYAKPDLRDAIKVCIRTGSRYGCEFAALERHHVKEERGVMLWVFPKEETKTRKRERRIIVAPEIAELVRQKLKSHNRKYVFHNSKGEPWTQTNLSERFRVLKRRLARKGIRLDDDACMYSCRHTYAKRILNGFWTGKLQTLEHLAQLMGNTPDVCRMYAQFVDSYQQPLLDAVGA